MRVIGADRDHRAAAGERRGPQPARRQDSVTDGDVIVLYATPQTVTALSGGAGYEALDFRLRRHQPGCGRCDHPAIRAALTRFPGFHGFTGCRTVRAAGDWPGKHDFERSRSSST